MTLFVEEAVVEDIVEWYVRDSGGSGPGRPIYPCFDVQRGRANYSALTPRDRIGLVLAECPQRVPAGDVFNGWYTVTPVERALAALVTFQHLCHEVGNLQMLQGTDVWPETAALQKERDLWDLLARRYRVHPLWTPAMLWLCEAFGKIVFGDPERGLRGDASFLPFVLGGLDNLRPRT